MGGGGGARATVVTSPGLPPFAPRFNRGWSEICKQEDRNCFVIPGTIKLSPVRRAEGSRRTSSPRPAAWWWFAAASQENTRMFLVFFIVSEIIHSTLKGEQQQQKKKSISKVRKTFPSDPFGEAETRTSRRLARQIFFHTLLLISDYRIRQRL